MKKTGARGQAGPPVRPGRANPDGLAADELTLWWHVVGGVTPLRGKDRVIGSGTRADGHEEGRHSLRQRTVVVDGPDRGLATVPRAEADSSRPRPALPSIATFDPRAAKKLARGRAGIDARLDLHGLRHDEARLRLRHFLRDAQAHGHTTVLVITGKGRPPGDRAAIDAPTWRHEPRGVLRRSLPGWLAEPDMLGLVQSFTSAASRHGGEGAVYVRLRRRR